MPQPGDGTARRGAFPGGEVRGVEDDNRRVAAYGRSMRLLQTKWARALIIVAAVLAVYAAVGFWVLPRIARTQIVQRASERLGREVLLERVTFNPFTFRVSVANFAVLQPDGERLAALRSGTVNFDAWTSLFTGQWSFGEVQLDQPAMRLEIGPDGALNIADLLESRPGDGEDQPPPEIGIDDFAVRDGRFHVLDRSMPEAPFESTVEPINFELHSFSTAPDEAGNYRLTGRTEYGATFDWTGRISVAPFASEGEVAFGGWELPRYMPILRRWLAGEITGGVLDLAAQYRVAFGEQREVRLSNLTATAEGVAAQLPQHEEPSVQLARLSVELPQAQLLEPSAQIARVALDGLQVRVERLPDGSIDLAQLIKAGAATATGDPAGSAAGNAPPDATDLSVQLEVFELNSADVTFVDHTLDSPAEIRVQEITARARELSTRLGGPVPFEGSAQLAGEPGELRWQGEVTPQPLRASVEVNAQGVALPTVTPYVRQFAAVAITGGAATADGRVVVERPEAAANLQVRWDGDLTVAGLQMQSAESQERLLGWERLQISGSTAEVQPLRVAAREVRLQQPDVSLVLNEGGELNLVAILPDQAQEASDGTDPAGAEDSPPAEGGGAPFDLQVGLFAIEGGTVRLDDQSVAPPFEMRVTDWNLTLRDLSSTPDQQATVETTASIAGAPFTLRGRLNPFAEDVLSGSDVQAELQQVPLDLFEPYIARFLGYRVERGRLRGDFAYQVSGDQLSGTNHVVLDEFFLGQPVESPQAISAPIKLGLAVLRNREDEIELNVPVSGTLTSPEFSLADTIQSAFSNVLVRAATAPFSILGSIFGGAAEVDLSQIAFAPGSSSLTDAARATLDAMARALSERPALELRVEPAPVPSTDREALREQQLAQLIADERARLSTPAAEGESGTVTDEDALRSLYRQRVAGGAPRGEPEAGAPDASGGAEASGDAPTEDRPPWLVRVFRNLLGIGDGGGNEPEAGPEAVAQAANGASPDGAPALDEVRQAVRQTVELAPDAVEALAQARARSVVDFLTGGGVAENRITVASPAAPPEGGQPIVRFGLEEAAMQAAVESNRGVGGDDD